jgi:hypothetical protein
MVSHGHVKASHVRMGWAEDAVSAMAGQGVRHGGSALGRRLGDVKSAGNEVGR